MWGKILGWIMINNTKTTQTISLMSESGGNVKNGYTQKNKKWIVSISQFDIGKTLIQGSV